MSDAAVCLPLPQTELAAPDWRRSTPASLISAFNNGDAAKFAKLIRRSPLFAAAARRRPDAEPHLCQQVLWSQHAFPETDRTRAWGDLLANAAAATKLSRKRREQRAANIAETLEQTCGSPAPSGFELLAGLSILLHDQALPDELFLRLWTRLQDAAQSLLKTPPRLAGRLTVDQRLLLLGELPWTYSLMFPYVKGARRARDQGAQHLKQELSQVCDEEGLPHAALLPRLPLCLAPFTRAAAIGALADDDWRDRDAGRRYRQLVLRTVALLQPDGRTALSNGVVHQAAPLLQAATESAGLKKSHHASVLATSLATTPTGRRERHRLSVAPRLKRKHRPSVLSDAAQLACLRNNWGVGADTCVIAFDGPTPRIDFAAFGVPILSGDWRSDAQRSMQEREGEAPAEPNGRSTTKLSGGSAEASPSLSAPAGNWECVCWFSESTADYVELQRTSPDGHRILRQALLSRDDHFLLLCDVVHAPAGQTIDYTVTLPLQGATTSIQDALTREWALQRGPLTLRILPLGLPQQSITRADGRLTIDVQTITLRQSSAGPRLACPLLLDWSPTRRKSPIQWRQLTVAENGRTLTPAESLGAHWRIGNDQWLYYHVLDGSDTPRTVLGHHTFHETVIAEINSAGDVNQLVQVESDSHV